MIYDSTLNVTWLQDWNHGAGSGFDSAGSGLMTWSNATAWADGLDFGGFNDWRLPKMVDTGAPGCQYGASGADCGYYVQTVLGAVVINELAHLYYETLGNGYLTGFVNPGPFYNIQPESYWSSLGDALDASRARYFHAPTGFVGTDNKDLALYGAVAVRNGDVMAAIPEPGALALSTLALLGAAVPYRLRRKALMRDPR